MEKLTQEKAKAVLEHIIKKNLLSHSGLVVCGIDAEFTRYITGRLTTHGIWIKIYTKESGISPITGWLHIRNRQFLTHEHEVVFLQQDVDWCRSLRTLMKAASNGNFAIVRFWTVINSNNSIERALVEMDLDVERQ